MNKKYVLKSLDSEDAVFDIDYQKELNDEQLAAVLQANGPALVLAGAGSGKTRTLVYRVAYMLEKGIKPDRILLMTFTNKAAHEMLGRIEQLLKVKPRGLWGGTFHHVGNRILRMYGSHIGIKNNFLILDQEDAKDLIKSCVAELDFPKDKYFPKADTILKIVSLTANANKSIRDIIEAKFSYLDEEVIPKIEMIAQRYGQKKTASNSLDYDDLLTKWNELLMTQAAIKEKLAKKFQYILVDEYQDTNYIQGEIIKHLAGPRANVLAVGDDSQSIYSFRGATVKNILQFPKIFTDAKLFKLETNYRSTPQILDLANASIRHNTNQFEKTLKTSRSDADKPVLAALYDLDQQADFVCQRILELHHDENVSLNDMAVLFRAHYQSLELEMALSKRNIPYEMRGGVRFFEQAHIKDVVAHIKALAHTGDELSWTRILRLQPGIGETTARRIWQIVARYPDAKSALAMGGDELGSKAASGWHNVQDIMGQLMEIGADNVSLVIQRIMKSGYEKHVAATFENALDRIDDLKQLVEFASSYTSVEKFLADVALSEGFKGQSLVDYQDGPPEAVLLSTVHQAKGLEWQVVFAIGLVDGQFPHAKVFEHPEEVEEERRLFYVAVTRAKEKLYLTYPIVNKRGDILGRPSQFITELPERVYDKWDIEDEASSDSSGLDDGEVTYVDEERGSILDIYLRNKRNNKF